MKLIPIDAHPDAAKILWDLMAEVQPDEAISHKAMPTWDGHLAFLRAVTDRFGPVQYDGWYLCEVDNRIVGYVYLTALNWIGIRLYRYEQGKGYGPQAIKALMDRHGDRRYEANVNPANTRSLRMFEKLGFRLAQHTLIREAA